MTANLTQRMRVVRATFTDDGKPDAEARVLFEPDGGASFSIDFAPDDRVIVTALPGDRMLQAAETFQFVADTLSTQVRGRLTPFVRGWVSTACDLAHKFPMAELDEPETTPEQDEELTRQMADEVAKIMIYAHKKGLPVAKTLEEMAK